MVGRRFLNMNAKFNWSDMRPGGRNLKRIVRMRSGRRVDCCRGEKVARLSKEQRPRLKANRCEADRRKNRQHYKTTNSDFGELFANFNSESDNSKSLKIKKRREEAENKDLGDVEDTYNFDNYDEDWQECKEAEKA